MQRAFGGTGAGRFAALCLLGCAALILCRYQDWTPGAVLSKLIASCAFLGTACASGALASGYGRVVLAGLVLSWFGDMFLLADGSGAFLAGLASFLLAHVAYIAAFALLGLSDRWSMAALAVVMLMSTLVSVWLAPYLPDELVFPVRAYTFVISLMVIASWGAFGRGADPVIPVGASLFYLSDISVAALQFTDPGWPVYVLGLPFYYTGQLLLAASVRFRTDEKNSPRNNR